jgi:hypothetical protein
MNKMYLHFSRMNMLCRNTLVHKFNKLVNRPIHPNFRFPLVQVDSNRLVCLLCHHVITRTCGQPSALVRPLLGRTGRPPPASSRSSHASPPSPCRQNHRRRKTVQRGGDGSPHLHGGQRRLVPGPTVSARGAAVDRSIVGKRAHAAMVRHQDGMARTRSGPEWARRASLYHNTCFLPVGAG